MIMPEIKDTQTTIRAFSIDFILEFEGQTITGILDSDENGDMSIYWGEVLPDEFASWLNEGFNEQRLTRKLLDRSGQEK